MREDHYGVIVHEVYESVRSFTEAMQRAISGLREAQHRAETLAAELEDATDALDRIGELAEQGDLAGVRAVVSIQRARR